VDLDYLLAIKSKRTEEYQSLQAVKAVALLAALMLLVGAGVLRALR
jgi:hypothetical protein